MNVPGHMNLCLGESYSLLLKTVYIIILEKLANSKAMQTFCLLIKKSKLLCDLMNTAISHEKIYIYIHIQGAYLATCQLRVSNIF